MKPVGPFKTVKGWAIVSADGISPDMCFTKRATAVNEKLIGDRERIIRVEIREVRRNKKERT